MKKSRQVDVRTKILMANQLAASGLREEFRAEGTLVVNLISSPGSGKTTLLEAAVQRLKQLRIAVLEGDIATERDADRIRRLGIPAHQILTGGSCHLDARQIRQELDRASFGSLDILFIENVGNLICPTSYDLGEDFKIAVLSVTEGEDKPFKYPAIFSTAALTVISKTDLLPYVDFNITSVREQVKMLNPNGTICELSARTGEGMEQFCSHLQREFDGKRR